MQNLSGDSQFWMAGVDSESDMRCIQFCIQADDAQTDTIFVAPALDADGGQKYHLFIS